MVYLLIAWWIFPWQTVSHNQMVTLYNTNQIIINHHENHPHNHIYIYISTIMIINHHHNQMVNHHSIPLNHH